MKYAASLAAVVGVLGSLTRAAAAESIDFSRDILPIFSSQCFECHGPDAGHRKADLRLDDHQNALAKHDNGIPIVPGRPQKSELIDRITTTNDDDRMPPPKKGPPLTADQIQLLRDWITGGAVYSAHWAFVPPKRPALPSVRDSRWVKTPVDNFVLHRLEQENLKPAKPATREVLARRAFIDLTGLPPTPKEIDAFLSDHSRDAFAHLIDRLLESPHYGERWGRHWLDVARYADSGGFETDIFFGHAWRYRDYVIRAFNADEPFDRFIKEQIAGDELYPNDTNAVIATGLYTTGPVLQESAMVTGKLEYDLLTDAVDTTGSAFLGLTIGCARCHDHKYDPISQKDYFALQAIFSASDQYDFKRDGTRTGRVAVKNSLPQFLLEQSKERARREKDAAARDQALREVGDFYIQKDSDLSKRIDQSRRYSMLAAVVEKYRQAARNTNAAAALATVTNSFTSSAVELASAEKQGDNKADDNADDISDRPDLVALDSTSTGDQLDDLLFEIGKRALELAGKRTKEAYAKLTLAKAKRDFLVAYGRQNLDVQKPDGYIEDVDVFRREIGAKHCDEPSEIPVRVLAHREKPIEVRLLKHGMLEDPGDVMMPAFPARIANGAAVGNLPPEHWRSALANWIASESNALTARVIVNRVWQWHFGEGLVRTPNDFGIRGERPTHPELLDWLAVDFMQHSWSIKHLHRMIMLSSAYQMSANADQQTLDRDPENRLLTRYQPRRLEAEVIWDSLRAVSGTLNPEMYGLPVAPPLDDQEQIGNFRKWPTSTPDQANRRAVYLLIRRSFRFPMLSAFDLPDNAVSCGRRDITTVPNQALTLLNNRTVKEQADAFADRLLRESHGDVRKLAALAWRYAYGRSITSEEQRQVEEFFKSHGAGNEATVQDLCLALFNTNEFIYVE